MDIPFSTDHGATQTDLEILSDVKELRGQAQRTTVVMIAALSWFAFLSACVVPRDAPGPTAVGLFLMLGAFLGRPGSKLGSRLATLVLVGSLCGAYAALIISYPNGPVRYVGVLVVIFCSTMLNDMTYLLLTIVLCLMLFAIELFLPGTAVGMAEIIRSVAILAGSAAGLAISRRHLNTALAWSREGGQSARQLNDELRDRQLKLNRALHSMEEATWRIERLNNELVLAQHRAEASRAAKERFASTVSHEIRGPLNLILGFSELLALSPERYGDNLNQSFYKDVDTIYRNTQHLSSLVDDVLDLSRIEAEHLPIIKSRVALREDVIEQVLESVRPLAENKGLYLKTEVSADLPSILADPVRLRQVVLNLLVNSLRLTMQGGITVRAKLDGSELVVCIEDTGPGIAAGDLPRLFREFQQLYMSGGHEAGGSGLGLSIAKHLIEAHGGRIWAESTLGQGTIIGFTVPLPGMQQNRLLVYPTPGIQYRVTERSDVVIVHQDPDVIASIQRCLENPHVVGVPDMEQVSEVVASLHPRAVITSHELESQVMSQLARLPFDIPMVSCGLPSVSTHDDLRGTAGYIVKPVRVETLRPFVMRLAPLGSATILIVDDDPDQVRLMETMIQGVVGTYQIKKAYSGTQAMEILETTSVDIVFLDWLMPQMDGLETMARLRDHSQFSKIKVVIVSAKDPGKGPLGLRTPLAVHCRRALPIAVGAKCIQALLDAVRPSYLEQPEPLEQIPTRSLG